MLQGRDGTPQCTAQTKHPCLQGTYSHRTAGLIHYDPHLNQSRWMQSDTKGGCSALPFAATTKSNNNAHNKLKKENFLYMKCSKADNESLNPMPNFNKTWKVGQTGNGKKLTERTGGKQHGPEQHGESRGRTRHPLWISWSSRVLTEADGMLHEHQAVSASYICPALGKHRHTSHPFCCRNIKPQRARA